MDTQPRGSAEVRDAERRGAQWPKDGSVWRPEEYCAAGGTGVVTREGQEAVPGLLVPAALFRLVWSGQATRQG